MVKQGELCPVISLDPEEVFILLAILIEIHGFERDLKGIRMGPEVLPQELGLNKKAIGCPAQAGLVRIRPQEPLLGCSLSFKSAATLPPVLP